MGFAYRTDYANRLNYSVATGYISGGDLEAHIRQTVQDKAFSYPQLIDARLATFVFTTTDVCWLAFSLRRLSSTCLPGPIGIVVSTGANLGMVQMLKRLAQDTCMIEPFLDITEAEDWLQVQKGEVA